MLIPYSSSWKSTFWAWKFCGCGCEWLVFPRSFNLTLRLSIKVNYLSIALPSDSQQDTTHSFHEIYYVREPTYDLQIYEAVIDRLRLYSGVGSSNCRYDSITLITRHGSWFKDMDPSHLRYRMTLSGVLWLTQSFFKIQKISLHRV